MFLNIVTITEIYVLCVNDSELKRGSQLFYWYSIREFGNALMIYDQIVLQRGVLMWPNILIVCNSYK